MPLQGHLRRYQIRILAILDGCEMAISRKYLLELRKELLQLFQTKDHKYQKTLEDKNFVVYLSDILGVMNYFNHYLQGPDSNIIDFTTKLTAIVRKLDL